MEVAILQVFWLDHIIQPRTRVCDGIFLRASTGRFLAASPRRGCQVVELGEKQYPVRNTPRKGLRQVDFGFDGNEIRGLEQNSETESRWAQMAGAGKRVMQFLSDGRYVANVVDGNSLW
jgi:hypothetical protein